MPPVPKKKHTRGQTKRGIRAKVSLPTLSKCPNCGKLKEPHKACPYCGYYR